MFFIAFGVDIRDSVPWEQVTKKRDEQKQPTPNLHHGEQRVTRRILTSNRSCINPLLTSLIRFGERRIDITQ